MAITTIDGIAAGLANGAQNVVINKASIATQIAGGFSSLWRATGLPAQGAIPTAAATCSKATTGGFKFPNAPGGLSNYIARLSTVCGNATTDVQIHDRLKHMGGLSGTVTTAQIVNAEVAGLGNRLGPSSYSEVQWWLEWYTTTGATGVTATVTYTNADGTSGRTTTVAITANTAASRMFQIIGTGGEYIQSIQTVLLSATTGTAGNFGVTATRFIGGHNTALANTGVVSDWQMLGLPQVEDDACLFFVMVASTTSTGTVIGNAKIIQR